jgi:hypothetical protein
VLETTTGFIFLLACSAYHSASFYRAINVSNAHSCFAVKYDFLPGYIYHTANSPNWFRWVVFGIGASLLTLFVFFFFSSSFRNLHALHLIQSNQ